MTDDECRDLRDAWRAAHPNIVKLWADIESVNPITPVSDEIADTSLNGAHGAPPTEGRKMFRTDTFDYVVLATLALSLLLTVVVR